MSILDKIIKKKDDKDEKKEVEEKKVIDDEKKKKKKEEEIKNIKNKDAKVNKVAINAKKQKKNTISSKIKKISKDKIPNNHFDLIKKPHISEKAFNLSNENQYVFVVSDKANKSEIKKAIGNLYGVLVVSVNIVSVPSKPKRFKGKPGVKRGYKKAIVKLAKNNTIDLMKEVK